MPIEQRERELFAAGCVCPSVEVLNIELYCGCERKRKRERVRPFSTGVCAFAGNCGATESWGLISISILNLIKMLKSCFQIRYDRFEIDLLNRIFEFKPQLNLLK